MVITETSLAIYNKTLYKDLNPETLPTWLRVNLANMIADDTDTWAKEFSKFNSGTHNAQWLVVDMKLTPGASANVVRMVEQIPGFITDLDVTDLMYEHGYLGSYNIAYNPYIFDVAGYREQGFSYWGDLRAVLLKEAEPEIKTAEDALNLIVSN